MDLTDLAAYWPFSEFSNGSGPVVREDLHGNNDTTNDVNNTPSGTGLVYSNAANFVAVNLNYLSIADDPDLQTGDEDFTAITWINPTTFPTPSGGAGIIGMGNAGDGAWSLSFGDGISPLGNELYGSIWNGAGYTGQTNVFSNFGGLSASTWYMLLLQYDSVNDLLGISVNNGTLDTAAHSGGCYNTPLRFNFGNKHGFSAYLDSRLGTPMYWKRLLTAQEKSDLYNSGAGLTYAAMVAAPVVGVPFFTQVGAKRI